MLTFINVRLSIPLRLALIGSLFIIPIVFLACIFIQQVIGDISFAKKELSGTRYLAEIWTQFDAAAKTGSLSMAGNTNYDEFDSVFGTAKETQNFLNAKDLTAKIEAGKTLIAAVADDSNLTLDTDLDSFYLMNAETVKMPRITSAILDIAAAALQPATSESRNADFAVAIDRLRSSLSGAISSVATARKYNPDGVTDKALSALSAMLKSAGDELLEQASAFRQGGGDVAKLDAAQRAMMSTSDSMWGATNTELARLLQARIDGLYHTMKVNLAFAGLFLIAASALSFFIARGLSSRLAGLLRSMDRLVKNDVDSDIPFLSDVNETGKIAKVLSTFKQTLIERTQLRSENHLMEQLAEERKRNEFARMEIARQQTEVVETVAASLGRLARADLTVSLHESFPGELDRLRSDLNSAAEQLRRAMTEIATMGQTVNTSAEEITFALDDLQSRTERAAASIEETSAAIEEISHTVKTSAEGTNHARKLVAAADENAKRSTSVVNQAITAMSGIAKAAQQITPIVGLMDEIAFQTNLLALNAGVEAARAGDAGRGFAVVASEVRALAQKSAAAAKEIKTLISMSTTQIGIGVHLVEETGKSLEQIRAQVGEINTIVENIANGASELAAGLAEFSEAIAEMDRTTQQNAAMAQKSTVACRSLASQSEQLATLISRFEIGSVSGNGRSTDQPPVFKRQPLDDKLAVGGQNPPLGAHRAAA